MDSQGWSIATKTHSCNNNFLAYAYQKEFDSDFLNKISLDVSSFKGFLIKKLNSFAEIKKS
jgi:hypothetical protein